VAVEFNKNLLIRLVTALSLLPVALIPVWYGGTAYLVLIMVAMALVQWEWRSLTQSARVLPTLLAIFANCLLLWHIGQNSYPEADLRNGLIICGLLVAYSFLRSERTAPWLWPIIGFAYTAMAGISLIWLRQLSLGEVLIIWLFFSVWGMDVGGYFAGKAIGGPKLAPVISPNKTWAGFVGGIVLAVLVNIAIYYLFSWETEGWPLWLASLSSALIAIMAQVGDLYESKLKRTFGVKDSGGLIPGHGGILDRVDGLIFGAAAAGLFMLCLFSLRAA